jgi:NAD(P)-dependent dehydrogenase (short-subunit alcohol dehydrogenase family)
LTRALLDGLRRRRGTVLLLGSDSAMLGFAGGSPYCASKGGVVGLTRALAVELAPAVRVLCISPGPVETDMMAGALATDADPTAARARWERYTPLRRVAQPVEVARLLAFAASDAAPFATGAVWAIDGGVTAGRLG